jgi:hypothetical protein
VSDYFSTPDDAGDIRQSDLQFSLGERLAAQGGDALFGPTRTAIRIGDYQRAEHGDFSLAAQMDRLQARIAAGATPDQAAQQTAQESQTRTLSPEFAPAEIGMDDAKARLKQESLTGLLTLPDQPTIKQPVLDLMVQDAHERRDREAAIARGPQGFIPGALGLVTSLGAGMIDPLNMAAFSIPVLGEAPWGRLMASAGDSILARTSVRALQGAAQGAVGTTALEPENWWLHTADGQDYTMAQSLQNVLMGAGMGGVFHAGFGGAGDVVSRLRGQPLAGSPDDQAAHALFTGRMPEEEPTAAAPASAEQLASDVLSESPVPPVHPAATLADLPPAAREDLARSAIADIAADQPVRGAEMLDIAADHDERIAESVRPAPLSADVPGPPKPRGRAAADPETWSLFEALASKGGLKPDPELEAIFGNKRGPFVPGFGPLIRKAGMRLDDALNLMKQLGYFHDQHDDANGMAGVRGREGLGLIVRDLLDSIDNEARGQKQYKLGHVERTRYDPEQEKHVILGELERQLHDAGEDVSAIDPQLLNRTVEIVHREGVSDVMDAYERAIMEDAERYNATADARQADETVQNVPGFDDAGTAPGHGAPGPGDGGEEGRPDEEPGGTDGPKPRGLGARAVEAARDPRWRKLADVRPAEDDPDIVAESREAARLPEPDSLVPERSLTALEAAAADAEAIWRELEPTLTEEERGAVNERLQALKDDKDGRDQVIKDAVTCLLGAFR